MWNACATPWPRFLDAASPEKSELYLAKLALLLSVEIGDAAWVLELTEKATSNLGASG